MAESVRCHGEGEVEVGTRRDEFGNWDTETFKCPGCPDCSVAPCDGTGGAYGYACPGCVNCRPAGSGKADQEEQPFDCQWAEALHAIAEGRPWNGETNPKEIAELALYPPAAHPGQEEQDA